MDLSVQTGDSEVNAVWSTGEGFFKNNSVSYEFKLNNL